MFITRGELGPENLGELKILAKYNLFHCSLACSFGLSKKPKLNSKTRLVSQILCLFSY